MASKSGGNNAQAIEVEVREDVSTLDAAEFNQLAGGHPFVSHEFFTALHQTGCASRKSGWQPVFLVLHRDQCLKGVMPLYLKNHSRGEYVFDYAWADAFERNGLSYYPKLLGAVPFSPVTGPRILAAEHADKLVLARAAIALCEQTEVSSLHVLFPAVEDLEVLREAGFMVREAIQFHWSNEGYANFDQFLERLTRDKRRKMRQDSRRVADAGVTFTWLRGTQISDADLEFFYECYCNTYRNHYSSPYLTLEFFRRIASSMPDAMLLILAKREGASIAAALNIVDRDTLYGRYWGSTEFVSSLHFEICYVQAIAYCIETGLKSFEGGAQGMHKMSRGLLPTATFSAHWVTDRRFSNAIAEFLEAETRGIEETLDELEERTPFKASAEPATPSEDQS
jgi:predicted N-acyltransferase